MNDMLKQFTGTDDFIGVRARLIREKVIPWQEKILKDEITDVPRSNAVRNFEIAARFLATGQREGEFYGMVFQDSDVAKWIEAAAYSLLKNPDAKQSGRVDAMIDLIAQSQHPDGYINTYFTIKSPELRWTNLHEAHELYCAGHLIEAAVAYAECTDKYRLVEIVERLVDHIYQLFVVEGHKGYPGHPEVELALMRLYHLTNNEKALQLAEHFINSRGVDGDFFIRERQQHPWTVFNLDPSDKAYLQNHQPVREQTDAVGHAVRAVYLYAGMADLALARNDEKLKEACRTLWGSITLRRMYITGGIGSAYEGEAFTKDYHLPNDTAYAETCASVGLIFFARRMLELEKKSTYADVMERALYNGVLSGMQLDGTRFFYVNPLESLPGISGEAVTHKHALPVRPGWFACACCPPNVARLLTSIGRYAWGMENRTVYAHLFISGELEIPGVTGGRIITRSDYPVGHQIQYRFAPASETMEIQLAIRLPDWSPHTTILKNGAIVPWREVDGYAYLAGPFIATDEVEVSFDMAVRRIYGSPRISSLSGRVAITRGPLIYCVEGIDHDGRVLNLRMNKYSEPYAHYSDKLNGIMEIHINGSRVLENGQLYSSKCPETEPVELTLIPYYAWSNRGLTEMRIWLPESE